ncbi:CAAX amino terminal protease self- immunity [Phycisphaerae bacterium RAS1]|nr:CAAX amino terminal protease self- immunity [Phycisphaerae bacterium RAS1]
MTDASPIPIPIPRNRWEALASARPDVVLMGPFLVYLALLSLKDLVPVEWLPIAAAMRGVGSLAVVWVFRRYLPPWGRPHLLIALPAGLFAAWGWMAGQYLFDDLGLGGRLPVFPGTKEWIDPRDTLGAGKLFWTAASMRILVACTAVPLVEELFWRAFMLRALVDWHHFDRLPLGAFAWRAMLLSSVLSTLQHPDNWGVSILCWLFFNALFYRTRSVLCLVIVHAVTNLALYLHVLRVGEWSFW